MDVEGLRATALDWLDLDLKPRLIVSRGQVLNWINDSARDVFARVSSVQLGDRHFSFRCAADEDRFQTYLGTIDDKLRTIAFAFDRGAGHVLFRGRYLPQSAAYCLEVALDHETYRPALADFEKVFGLTGSEARTAAALFDGQSVAEVASMHNVSIDTVRTHVRQLYAKLGTGTREQFFRRLQPYRVL